MNKRLLAQIRFISASACCFSIMFYMLAHDDSNAVAQRIVVQADKRENSEKLSPAEVITQKWRELRRGIAKSHPLAPSRDGLRLLRKSAEDVLVENKNCVECHQNVPAMHISETVNLSCIDCHGGNALATVKEKAHVLPRFPDAWKTSANPERSYTLLNHESPEFIRFVNPGDLRVAQHSCGKCHQNEHLQVRKSMMTHGCMLWGAALYNNGAVPGKYSRYGESYSENGVPQRVFTVPPPTQDEIVNKGVLPFIEPLPRFQVTQPGNILRIFERGGIEIPEDGIPFTLEEPGLPRFKLGDRGLGTQNRTDPVFIGLQKTRLLDPTLNFLGTNDHSGDYRSSGCTACHVVYANDSSPVHSGSFAVFGSDGKSFSGDPTIPKNESGHPIRHKFTVAPPSSQCIVCHVHPGTNVLNSYLGFMWWDNETDGELMYPKQQRHLTPLALDESQRNNPNDAAARGLWSDPEFLKHITELNDKTKNTQFADFNGHGWVFRAVFKKDRHGNLLDHRGKRIQSTNEFLREAMKPPSEVEKVNGKFRDDVPVHLMDIHLEKGMHCVDCHFSVDNHGNTKLYGEVRAAIEITCKDCHGKYSESVLDRLLNPNIPAHQKMTTSGPAAPQGGTDLFALDTPFAKPRFEVQDGRLIQNSMVEPDVSWEVVQTKDTINPSSKHYNHLSHMAKTARFEESSNKVVWGGDTNNKRCAHEEDSVSCVACHTSWNTSCFGCHLTQKANAKKENLHFEGDITRNYTSYNFQTLRDDVFMLARDGNVMKGKISPARSACAIHVSSFNRNRENIYTQQQTVSADGLSGIAFSTNVPHTIRGGTGLNRASLKGGTFETKMCTDCHLSAEEDNNAIMAQLLMQGTNYVNFIGQYAWVAAGHEGLLAIKVTEQTEPQAVIGSTLHQIAYPEEFKRHTNSGKNLKTAYEHPGMDILDELKSGSHQTHDLLDVQQRGEYVYAACGKDGIRIFDTAFIDHKGFSERIVTAPVSPLGQRLYLKTKYATSIAVPTTMAPNPVRRQQELNQEPQVPLRYGFIYATDKYEGFISIFAATLLDGNPLNNFLEHEYNTRFNPDGLLDGANSVTIVGKYAYVCCSRGVVILDITDPRKPLVSNVLETGVQNARKIEVQFRYGFLCDDDGLKVLDVSNLKDPKIVAVLSIEDARSVYVARTYAYISAGAQGMIVVDVETPRDPQIVTVFNDNGNISDLYDIQLGITNVSEFAYLADGENGFHVVQLTDAGRADNGGFSPVPIPKRIATYHLHHHGKALAISKGLDRDRAADESGAQIAVFGRIGARPLGVGERNIYLRKGVPWKVTNDPFDRQYFEIQHSADLAPIPLWPVRR